eukprot:1737231-Pyramimonas_sp.AAC.1
MLRPDSFASGFIFTLAQYRPCALQRLGRFSRGSGLAAYVLSAVVRNGGLTAKSFLIDSRELRIALGRQSSLPASCLNAA